MVQRYIKELDTELTGSYTTATELVNLNDMHSVKQSELFVRSKLSEFATYDKTF